MPSIIRLSPTDQSAVVPRIQLFRILHCIPPTCILIFRHLHPTHVLFLTILCQPKLPQSKASATAIIGTIQQILLYQKEDRQKTSLKKSDHVLIKMRLFILLSLKKQCAKSLYTLLSQNLWKCVYYAFTYNLDLHYSLIDSLTAYRMRTVICYLDSLHKSIGR